MRKLFLVLAMTLCAALFVSGCGKIKGPRFWWDDRNQERLSENYELPADPGAVIEADDERRSSPTGEDLTEDNLRDYRTNLDQEEEKRKADSSLLDF